MMNPLEDELLPDGTPAYLAAPEEDLVPLPMPQKRVPQVSFKPQLGAPTPQGFVPESLVDDAPKASDGSPFPDFSQTTNRSKMLADYLRAKRGGRDFSDEARQAEMERAKGGGGLALLGLGLSTLGSGIRGQSGEKAMSDFRDVRQQRYDQTVGEFDKQKALGLQQLEKDEARNFQQRQLEGLEGYRKAQLGVAERKAVADSIKEKFDQNFKIREQDALEKYRAAQLEINRINANKAPNTILIAGPNGQAMPIEQARYEASVREAEDRKKKNFAELGIAGFELAQPDKILPTPKVAEEFRAALSKNEFLKENLNNARSIIRQYGTNPALVPAAKREELKQAIQNTTDTLRILRDMGVPSGKDAEMLRKAIGVDAELTLGNVMQSYFKTPETADKLLSTVSDQSDRQLESHMTKAGYRKEGSDKVKVVLSNGKKGEVDRSKLDAFILKHPDAKVTQ